MKYLRMYLYAQNNKICTVLLKCMQNYIHVYTFGLMTLICTYFYLLQIRDPIKYDANL